MAFDPLYLYMVLPALVFTIFAQAKVSGSFNKYSKMRTSRGVTGVEAAHEILRRAGLDNVRVERVSGRLTDHFDPRSNVIRLSDAVYSAATVAAVGVAAHEAGHAIQYAKDYAPIKLRSAILPVTSFGSKLALPLVLFGFAFNMTGLINLAILLFAAVVVFQIITLPVEFNASSRAVNALKETMLLTPDEIPASRKVLTAAAMTYVGALALSLVQLLRFIIIAKGRR